MKFIGKSILLEEGGEKVIVIGDLHIGYEQGIHQAGVATSFIMDTCTELESIFKETGRVTTCVLLGDVIHRFTKAGNDEWRGVRAVFAVLQMYSKEIIVVRGNHDVSLAPLLREFTACLIDSWTWQGYCCVHGDKDLPLIHTSEVHTWIIGHGHPAFRLRDGAKSELYKCFLTGTYQKKHIILVPSFFSGVVGTNVGQYVLPYPWKFHLETFEVYLIEQTDVLPFGTLGTLIKE
ncbi:metallophosphoesterase [Candidatus Pacearchaeota archaeon]|nr:metallophosphoesterase [Candidatus Pacearchaeota archaeon]